MKTRRPGTLRARTKAWATATATPFLPAATPQADHRHGTAKPSWRGRQHAIAFLAAVPASATAIAVAPRGRRWPMAVYTSTLMATLATSAAYHTLATTPRAQQAMSRVDRATVYTLIAGTTTPALAYTTPPRQAAAVLAATWAAAAAGATARATGKANRTATAGYVALGWAGALTGARAWKARTGSDHPPGSRRGGVHRRGSHVRRQEAGPTTCHLRLPRGLPHPHPRRLHHPLRRRAHPCHQGPAWQHA